MLTVFLILGGAIGVFIFARSLFILLFSMQNYGNQKERMKQLRQTGSEEYMEESDTTINLINTLTKPIMKYFLPKLKFKNMEQLEKDLKFTGWDKYFSPAQFQAMNYLLKVIGVLLLLVLFPFSKIFAVVFFLIGFFLFEFLFNNSIKNLKEVLFKEFPDFIRIIQGYLMANVPLTKAVEETLPYVGPEWQAVLKDFVLNCNLYSVPVAIDLLCEEVEIFEVRELFSLVKLNLEQGINVKESFESQSDKVADLQMEVMLKKIGTRQMMTIIMQGPLLLCMFLTVGLPTFYQMMTF